CRLRTLSSATSSRRSLTSAATSQPRRALRRPPADQARTSVRSSERADARELFDGRDPGRDLADAVFPHRVHALLDGGALDLLARRLGGRKLLEALAHLEQLKNADAAAVAGLPAAGAPVAAQEGRSHQFGHPLLAQLQPAQLLRGGRVGLCAVRAQLSGEP